MALQYYIKVKNNEVPVWVQRGTTLSVKMFSETRVHGTVQGNQGDVKSSTSFYNEVWIEFFGGEEKRFVFPYDAVSLRQGQVVTLLYNKKGTVIALLNHNTKKYDMIGNVLTDIQQRDMLGCFFIILLGAAISFGIYMYLKTDNLWSWEGAKIGLPFLILTIYAISRDIKGSDKIKNEVMPQIEEIFNYEFNK